MPKSELHQAIAELADSLKKYLEIRLDLFKLDVIEKSSRVISLLISVALILLVFSLFFLFASWALALWLGTLLGSQILGFLSVAGFFLLLTIVFYLLRKRLFLSSVIKHLSQIIFKNTRNNEEGHED